MNTNLEKIIKAEDFINKICIPQCPLECNRTEYKAFLTNSHFSSEIYLDFLRAKPVFKSKYEKDELTLDVISQEIVKLNVYYDSLTYTVMSEAINTNIFSLFSSIGGFMGMFLGMSLITLIEILELLIRAILILF